MTNKYLEKSASLPRFSKLTKAIESAHPVSLASLGVSSTGLGISAANFITNRGNARQNEQRGHREEESLSTLKGIHESLLKPKQIIVKPKIVIPAETNKHLNKIASMAGIANFAKGSVNLAKAHPLPAVLGAHGALDGALKTTEIKRESNFRTGVRGIRNTLEGAAKGVALGAGIEALYRNALSHTK